MPASINDVRNTVLAIANKNNYGYISPQDFNLYAQQAQMDMFENYFYQYNSWIIKQNQRTSGSGYADIVKGLVEVIDSFSLQVFLQQNVANTYILPADYYFISKLFYYPSLLFSGTTTATTAGFLSDGTATFSPLPVTNPNPPIGSIVVNTTDLTEAYVTSVNTATLLGLSEDIMTTGETYSIYSNVKIREVERVSQNKIFYLTSSNLTAPTTSFPAYVLDGTVITTYPSTIMNLGDIQCQYIRYPLDPQWTWNTLVGGEPIFDATQPGFQEFELPDSDEPALISRICQYVGIEIREKDVYGFGEKQELKDQQITS